MCAHASQSHLVDKLQIFKIQGRDKSGRKILRIVGKFFADPNLSVDVVNKYLEERIYPRLEEKKLSILYIHTGAGNFPGISYLRSIFEAIPIGVRENLEAVFFVHPSLQARLFLATFGRSIFTGGLYGKVRYVNRVAFLWDHVRRSEIEMPEYVYDHDEDLEYRPMMDYGLESDHPRVYSAPAVDLDSPVSMYSMRCIS